MAWRTRESDSRRQEQEAAQRERMTYVTLVGLFLGVLGVFITRERDRKQPFAISPPDLALLALATYRAGRMVAYDRVVATVPGAGHRDRAGRIRRRRKRRRRRHRGAQGDRRARLVPDVRRHLGRRWPGLWAALAPGPTRLFAAILGVSGLAELFSETEEVLTWSAQAARKRSAA